ASSERNSLTNNTASSNGLVPRSSRYSSLRMRETVASETPITEASILAVISRRSAARSVALVRTAFSAVLAAVCGCIALLSYFCGKYKPQKFIWKGLRDNPQKRSTEGISVLLVEQPALAGPTGHRRVLGDAVAATDLRAVERPVGLGVEILG